MNEAFGKENILFDRSEVPCQVWKQGGAMTAAWLSLTRVMFEGYCGHGHEIRQRSFDLLQTDAWLRGEANLPDHGVEAVITRAVSPRRQLRLAPALPKPWPCASRTNVQSRLEK